MKSSLQGLETYFPITDYDNLSKQKLSNILFFSFTVGFQDITLLWAGTAYQIIAVKSGHTGS